VTVVALCGGVGGAKLALGLYRVLPSQSLAVIVNTGDDFDLLGLRICPDLDTVLYTLAGLADPQRGWGRREETWNMMHALIELGGPGWFQLGDADLALHLLRSEWLHEGASLSECMARLAEHLRVQATLIPMTDERVATRLSTDSGELAFQEYFVARRCEPRVISIRFLQSNSARAPLAALDALGDAALQAIVICPSNPYLSIDPILAIDDLRRALSARTVPCVAISPLIGGAAVKGPTAKIMSELGLAVSAETIARHYDGLIDALVIDESDMAPVGDLRIFRARTLMRTLADRDALARFALQCASESHSH
jgi:LPPG:FO 2-phospho-L-lactate transferase